jgi:hypothetical protein
LLDRATRPLDAPAVAVIDDGEHLLRRRDVEALEAAVRRRRRTPSVSASRAWTSSDLRVVMV